MKQFKNKTALVLLLLVTIAMHIAKAGGELDDLRKMNKTYLQAKSFSMKVHVEAFQKSTDAKAMFTYNGSVKRAEGCYFTEINGRLTMKNPDYTVLVDDENKVIVVGKSQKEKSTEGLEQFMMTDSLFGGDFKYKTIKSDADKKVIEITAKNELYWENKKMELTIDAKNNTLKQVVVYPKTDGDAENEYQYERIVMKYEEVKLNTEIAKTVFAEENYVKITGKKVEGLGKYAGYKVVDQVHGGNMF